MKGSIKYFFLGAFMVATGLWVWAVDIPNTFAPNTPIKAAEVNANFSSLKAAIESLKVGGLVLPAKLEGTNPNTGSALLTVSTKGIGSAIYGISNDPTSAAAGVQGDTSSPGGFGVYGLARVDGSGTGVYGQGGIGVWGKTTAQTTKGYGVYGESSSGAGYGVFGKAISGTAGVHGETSNANGSGVEGKADGNNAAGVFGVNPSGPGVWGRSTNSSGVYGESTSGIGAYGKSGSESGVYGLTNTGRAGVLGINTANVNGSGVEGRGNGTNAAGVFGVNPTGPGVWGRSTSGIGGYFESDSGYAIQGKTRFTALSVESSENTAAIVTTRGTGVSAFIINQWGTGNIITARDASNAEVFRVLNDGSVFSKTNSYTSDRGAKTNFRSVNALSILEKVAAMPISRWNYKSDAASIAHIGPMAQDFHAAFGLNGSDDTHINTVDAQGIALAAIQGLNQKLRSMEAENAQLRAQLATLEARLSRLEGR